jgi:DNA mismatch repair protein MutL
LNGRHIKDRFIQHALREAFRGLTEPGRHPAAILMLDVPPGDVDVNVHPTKIEVRFRDGGRVHGLVHSGVREKLLENDLTPAAVPISSDMTTTIPEPLRQDIAREARGVLPRDAAGAVDAAGDGVAQAASDGVARSLVA